MQFVNEIEFRCTEIISVSDRNAIYYVILLVPIQKIKYNSNYYRDLSEITNYTRTSIAYYEFPLYNPLSFNQWPVKMLSHNSQQVVEEFTLLLAVTAKSVQAQKNKIKSSPCRQRLTLNTSQMSTHIVF